MQKYLEFAYICVCVCVYVHVYCSREDVWTYSEDEAFSIPNRKAVEGRCVKRDKTIEV